MTRNIRAGRDALDRLAVALAQETLDATDDDTLAEFRETHGDPERHAAEMRDLFERAILIANKRRLAVAKREVAANRRVAPATIALIDVAEARRRLRAVLDVSGAPEILTLAARKESELSDTDILTMIEDLRELGLIRNDDEENRK